MYSKSKGKGKSTCSHSSPSQNASEGQKGLASGRPSGDKGSKASDK